MLKLAGVVAFTLFLFAEFAAAQDTRFSASINAGDVITSQTQGNGITQNATQSLNILVTARMRIAPKCALEVNYGRADNSQKYDAPPYQVRIQDEITEFSGDFVLSPYKRGKITTFALIGGGVLYFGPTATLIDEIPQTFSDSRQTRTAVLYGVGADYKLLSRFALRLQYRGLFYTPPDFKVSVVGLFTGGHAQMAEPSVGLVFKF